MTAIWGPLGWMTLHSVSTSYPETPTITEKQLMSSWLDLFRDTITCPHCKEHFTGMLATYRAKVPRMLNSRQDFALFAFRAHNSVNRRLKKPILNTVAECMTALQTNIKTRSAHQYRLAYLAHIQRHWSTLQDISGITSLRKIAEMKKIENEYLSRRDTNFSVTLAEDIVLLPIGVLEEIPKEVQPSYVRIPNTAPMLRLGPGGFRLRK